MLLARLQRVRGQYPSQFWLMFWGMLISTVGSSMIWPFLMIYITKKLDLPMAQAASLMTINATVGLISAFIAGPVIDRFGRKWIMALSLLAFGGIYSLYTQANSYPVLALLMGLTGLVNPLYRVGADAMMVDLIPPDKRADAYALMRMSHNLGIAVGPVIGGTLAMTSYNFAFMGAAIGMITYALLTALFARETLPERSAQPASDAGAVVASERFGGYLHILTDRPFMSFIFAFILTQMCAALIWVLLSVHANVYYGVPENQYAFIAGTNAIMVVVFQAFVTRRTKRYPHLPVLAVGSLIYAAAVLLIGLSASFLGFWTAMVVMTAGELMLMPTSTTYTANIAPVNMRGRYMSIYGLTWNVAQGIAPLAGGFLSDTISPSAPWFAGSVVGLVAVVAFAVLGRIASRRAQVQGMASRGPAG